MRKRQKKAKRTPSDAKRQIEQAIRMPKSAANTNGAGSNASIPHPPSASGAKCRDCASPGIVSLAYANCNLCKKHFLRSITERFKRTVREFGMIKKGEHIAVGLSGGKDSTVMLYLLHDLQQLLPFKMTAVIIDEGIAGYRKNTMKIALAHCKKLGIPYKISSFKNYSGKSLDAIMKSRKGESACGFCGVFRRTLLNKACKEIHADKLAIGHNLDDAVQTFVMNLARNEPLRLARFGGISGIAEEDGLVRRIKPLIRIPEREIALFAMLSGIELHFQECPYAHEALRQHVRGMINEMEEKYPGTKFRIFNSYLSLKGLIESGAKEEMAKLPQLKKCKKCGEPTSSEECAACKMLHRLS